MSTVQEPTVALVVTPVAATEVLRFMEAEGVPVDKGGLRVSVQPGGCSGFKYGLLIEDQAADDDFVVDATGFRMFVDPFSAPYLQGTTIDFLNTIQEAGFKIDNPNAVSSCGCGHSFQVEEGEELPEGTHVGGCGDGCSH